ncbi:hypothetical protein H0H93_001933 [Arthromyces matolae]|nr:hypothetical protein H0H93_001933 [Arthromyces matolae]
MRLMVLVGLGAVITPQSSKDDTRDDVQNMVGQILSLRVFADPSNPEKMWKASVKEIEGEILCVSQFTLLANIKKDAGSSGSRLQIYSWKDPKSIAPVKGTELEFTLPRVEKGTEKGEDWVTKVEPGISSFGDNPQGVGQYLQPLLSHARKHIPPSLEKETPLFLLATAGMRLLDPIRQALVLQETCRFLTRHSDFKIDGPSDLGPCGSSIRIITGEEEGLFGWIAVNYLMDGFTGIKQDPTTYGFLDMGGASTQIAFEPPGNVSEDDAKDLIDVRLRLLGGQEIKHRVFVTTWLGYGTNQARERYVEKTISDFSKTDVSKAVVPDPCLPKGLDLPEKTAVGEAHPNVAHELSGTGSFEQCILATAPLLNKTATCEEAPCLMDGIHVPPIDFSVSHFIGVSEYWYSTEHIFGLGGAYDFVQYERAAAQYCSRPWDDIMRQHELSKSQNRLGGDGEVEEDGKVVAVGQWHPSVERSRLEMQCFKAAWIVNVLHEGIGIPRLTDPNGNVTTAAESIEKEAEKKGLGRPAFQSLDTVGDIAISWTLGKMVLQASKEVPSSSDTRPLVDPIEELPNTTDFHIKPIRPLWSLEGLEDRISPHLPSQLTRTSLGFSPVFFLLAVTMLFFVVVVYPLRRQLRGSCLRSLRQATRRDDEYALEEGILNGSSRPGTPTSSNNKWLYPIRRVFSPNGTKPPSLYLGNTPPNRTGQRHINMTMPLSRTPSRSWTLPNDETSGSSTQYALGSTISRSPSPSPALFEESGYFPGNGLTSSLARSRNTSQMSLSGSISRQLSSRNGNPATIFLPDDIDVASAVGVPPAQQTTYRHDDDEDLDRGPVKVTEGADDEEGFEWVPRRAGTREEAYQHLPPHVRYGPYGSGSMYGFTPPPVDPWNPGMSMSNMGDHNRMPYHPWPNGPIQRSPSPATPFRTTSINEENSNMHNTSPAASSHIAQSVPKLEQPAQPQHPNLQVHLHVNWHSDLRITLTTSLLINYPSPLFMSLPIKLSITGLVFNGELAVAYEGERRRIHICILDDLDPYGPAGSRPKRESAGSTPPELDEDTVPTSNRPSKPLPVGQRLLPNIYIESEIGQADKHVLKNVTRVERFIQDVIRKTIEEELVFPNFHTLVMGNQNS